MVLDIKCTEFSNIGYAVIFLGQAQEIPVDHCKIWVNPFNSQIKFLILLAINHTILIMLVQRIKY